jgi:hypothetical protein
MMNFHPPLGQAQLGFEHADFSRLLARTWYFNSPWQANYYARSISDLAHETAIIW